MSSRIVRAVAIASIAVVLSGLLTGCVSLGGPPAPPKQAEAAPFTCSDFLSRSSADLKKYYKKKTTWYTSTGTVQSNGIKELTAACKDNQDGYLTDQGAECKPYVALDPSVRPVWLAAVTKGNGYEGTSITPTQLLDTCTNLSADSDSLLRALSYTSSFPTSVSWTTESQLGYKTVMGVGVGPLIRGKAPQYYNGDSSSAAPFMGATCGYDPSTDAMIPVLQTARNTTDVASKVINGSYGLRPDDVSGGLITSVKIETRYGNGPQCSTPSTPVSSVYSTVQWTDALQPGANANTYSVIVLKNFYSPRYPAGASAELADWTLFSQSWPDSDDPIVSITSAALHLDGSPAS